MPQQELQRVIQYADLATLQRKVPRSWIAAAGILRNKKRAIEQHAVKIRKEWSSKNFVV